MVKTNFWVMINRWFEKRGMILTLVFLHEKGKSNQNAVSKAIRVTSDTLRKSVTPELEKRKLIATEHQEDFPFSIDMWLTEEGKKVATKLREAGIFDYP